MQNMSQTYSLGAGRTSFIAPRGKINIKLLPLQPIIEPQKLPPTNPQSDESHQLGQHSSEGKSVEDYYKNLNFPKNQEPFTPKY
ncbi:hypothetical protein GcM1_209008 [Golovinomyces cichoracearum]|uniref:Uncharacterized protein n=1 Tax=Golovinomyces cichoracearum TaxID=62708 RepID=A0A420IVS5_9PEZI|nr:hypothetical protein GcM1_209008 [Golovinomyces cichoracearum]